MSKLYRVIRRRTESLQPAGTFWKSTVLYCGYSRDEARRAYYSHEIEDSGSGYGNPAVETICEGIEDAGADDFTDDEVTQYHASVWYET